jgi:hypothetical protein
MDPLSRERRRRRCINAAVAWGAVSTLFLLLVISTLSSVVSFSLEYSAGSSIKQSVFGFAYTIWKRQSALQRTNSVHYSISSNRRKGRSGCGTVTSLCSAATEAGTSIDLNGRIETVFRDESRSWDHALQDALNMLGPAENALMEGNNSTSLAGSLPNHATYTFLLTSLAGLSEEEISSKRLSSSSKMTVVDQVVEIFQRLKRMAQKFPASTSLSSSFAPTRVDYNAVLLTWSKSYRREAGQRCEQLLTELWSQYNASSETANTDSMEHDAESKKSTANVIRNPYCPSHSTYVSTLTALARSGTGRHGAERAEFLLDEMERLSSTCPDEFFHLRPTTICVNIVL